MKLSDLIFRLSSIYQDEGDKDVVTWDDTYNAYVTVYKLTAVTGNCVYPSKACYDNFVVDFKPSQEPNNPEILICFGRGKM
jgi:hypothetical protein